ncbi:MAG: putative nucleotidyltransferase [Candidatus Krumholzibacteriia bacterium]|jgi:predicted nucleotidyltransferase
MKSEMKSEYTAKPEMEISHMSVEPHRVFELKAKGTAELKFAKWRIFGGYGNKRTLNFGETFAFVPHRSMDSNAEVTRFTVYKSTADKKAGSSDVETWVLSSPRSDAVEHLRVSAYLNGFMITNMNLNTPDVLRAFEITVNDGGARKLDPELKIKKKDTR